jgi:hypothetical protein
MPSPLATLKLFGLAPTHGAFAKNVKSVHDLKAAVVKSTTRLYANDCFLYRKSKSECILQQDLDTIQKWKNQCLMRFNPDKCEVLQITTRTTPLQ